MSLASYITYTKREAKSDKVFHKNRKEQSKSTPKSIAIFEVLAFIPDRFLEQSSLPVSIDPTKINSFTFILARNNEKGWRKITQENMVPSTPQQLEL